MSRISSTDILEALFIANPKYELVVYDRLPAEHREVLRDFRKDPDFYGILRPRETSGMGVKSVSRDTALLFLTLQQSGNLPEYVRSTLGERCNQEMTRLVLDGVLSVERNGKFVSGAEAAALLCGGGDALPFTYEAEGFLGSLSLEALRYGQGLKLTDPIVLSARLYGYNRLPLSPYWKKILHNSAAVVEFLSLGNGRTRELLDREWIEAPQSMGNDGWLAWQSRRSTSSDSLRDRKTIACKLYISPKTGQLREVFPLILSVLGRSPALYFKIGKDAAGLLRPDKMVAYFSRYEDLMDTAGELNQELAGYSAQGVPFTAELGGGGLLSWGVDPPADEHVLPWMGLESWRLWVTNRLAVALIAARADESTALEPWQFALRRLQFEGVDIHSWTPMTQTGSEASAWRIDFP